MICTCPCDEISILPSVSRDLSVFEWSQWRATDVFLRSPIACTATRKSGAEATKACARTLGLCEGRKVLDVGSGIGGPSRMLAATTGCEVVGVELQSGLVAAATDLTRRAGLDSLVSFRCGDAADDSVPIEEGKYHHAISLLVLLHLDQKSRERVLRRMYDSLVDGGTILIEDFIQRPGATLTEEELRVLKDVVHAQYVPSASTYAEELRSIGFVDVDIEDMSTVWRRWTSARSLDFSSRRAEMEEMYGTDTVNNRASFYAHIDALFDGKNLGGARITARKPLSPASLEASVRHSMLFNGHDMAVKDEDAALRSGPVAIHERDSKQKGGSDGARQTPQMPTEAKGDDRKQPSFPAPGTWKHLHDSLQYHFVVPERGLCFAARVFYTPSMYHHSVWARSEAKGAWELVASDVPMEADGSSSSISLKSPEVKIVEDPTAGGGNISVKATSEASGASSVEIDFVEEGVFAWLPAGQSECVIHRPNLRATIKYQGETLEAWGYSKRYFGDYPSHWGYRFIHGIGKCGDRTAVVWTADATFGLSKYNYFHSLLDGRHLVSKADDTYQQFGKAYGVLAGEDAKVSLEDVGNGGEWIREIKNDKMNSCMRQRICELEFVIGSDKFTGFAINETCYGTVC